MYISLGNKYIILIILIDVELLIILYRVSQIKLYFAYALINNTKLI